LTEDFHLDAVSFQDTEDGFRPDVRPLVGREIGHFPAGPSGFCECFEDGAIVPGSCSETDVFRRDHPRFAQKGFSRCNKLPNIHWHDCTGRAYTVSMRILGLETSCDETAAAVVEGGTRVLSNVIATSVDSFSNTGGVIPEQAARHQE